MSSSSKPPQHLNSTGCHIKVTPGKGRGVFASRPITSNTVIEISPVLLFSKDEYEAHGKHTVLDHYTFKWKDGTGAGRMALALGLGSLFNHSRHPNVSYTLDISTDSICYRTCRDVEEGEELCIYYGSQLWFETEHVGDGSSLSEEEEDGWGGLSTVAGEEARTDMDRHEIIDEERLPFMRLKPPPEEETLEDVRTAPAWVIDVPDPRYLTALLKWLKKTGLDSPDLGHLKRIRKHDNKTTLLVCLGTDVNDTPPTIPDDLLPSASLYQLPVPLTSALTPTQLALKNHFWPTYYTPRKKDQVEDWTRAQCQWAKEAMSRAVAEGKKARAKGELAIGAYVPAPFQSDGDHEKDNSVSGYDTRNSTSHPLRHAVLNLVREMGESHNNKAESNAPSYLLTSRSIFLTHEPCIMCTMALLHSRVKEVFYLIPMKRTGGCGGGDGAGVCPPIPWLKGVNHRFEICRWTGTGRGVDHEGLGIDEDLDA